MIGTVRLQGWAVGPASDLAAMLVEWRPAGHVELVGDAWRVVRPAGDDEPIGPPHRLVVVSAPTDVDVMPGSQGLSEPPPPNARTVRVTVSSDDVLVVDARCWLRIAGSATRGAATWERI